MSIFELSAQIRENKGRGASRRLRSKEGQIPAIIYGAGEPAVMISLQANAIKKATDHEAFYSHILTLNVNGQKHQAILKSLQRHPCKSNIIHMDFLRITGKEKISMHVPLHFKGEEEAPGVKAGGAVTHHLSDLEIKCLPKDLPEFIEIDISKMELNDIIHLSNLKLPSGVEFALHHLDEAHDAPVVSIHMPRVIVEEEVVTEEAPAEGETTAEAAPSEAEGSTETKS